MEEQETQMEDEDGPLDLSRSSKQNAHESLEGTSGLSSNTVVPEAQDVPLDLSMKKKEPDDEV